MSDLQAIADRVEIEARRGEARRGHRRRHDARLCGVSRRAVMEEITWVSIHLPGHAVPLSPPG
jgi:hypothetical protein